MSMCARAVKLTLHAAHCHLLYATRSRSFHSSVIGAAKVQSRKAAKVVKSSNNVDQVEKSRAPLSSEASEVCDKLQVLPFNLSPEKALKQAMGHSCAWLSHEKLGGSILQLVWQYARAQLGFSSRLVLPGLEGIKVSDLPSHMETRLSLRLKVEREDSEYTWEIEVLDGSLIGTRVEPLASLTNIFNKISDLADALEPYNPQTHRTIPKSEDYTIEVFSNPIRVAFSRYPPNISRVHKEVTRQFNHDTVKFTGDGETPFVAAYPILLSCYLFELYDRNDTNTKVKSSSITCLVLGRDLPQKTLPVAVCQDAIWRPIRKTREFFSTATRIFPTVLDFDAYIVKTIQNHYGKPPSTVLMTILSDMQERFFPKLARQQKNEEFGTINRELLPDFLERLKNSCEHVTANLKLSEVKRWLNDADWIMSYPEHARRNKEFLKASAEVRLAEHRVAIAELRLNYKSHTTEALHTSQTVKRVQLKAETASSTEESETYTLDEAYTELRAAKARLQDAIAERIRAT